MKMNHGWIAFIVALVIIVCGAKSPAYALSDGPAGLADYWAGKARWKLVNTYPMMAGDHITIEGGVWYLFSRSFHSATPSCGDGLPLGTQVQQSNDRGQTWTSPIAIIEPTPGTPWECNATDGDAYYDAAVGTWHYLFQCSAPNSGWNGCHVTRESTTPMGTFYGSSTPNPVIPAGMLWGNICNSSVDDCVRLTDGVGPVSQEGTFNIFYDAGGFHYVSFHGYDGVRGYRGIAKTTDFVSWIVGDPSQGVPTDSIFDPDDAQGWRETWDSGTSIGGGAGSILYDNGYFYHLVEAGDKNLACQAEQTWDIGILRSPSLTNLAWEQFPGGNPIYYSRKDPVEPCEAQYGRLFRDPATNITYMMVTRWGTSPGSNTYLYQLVSSSNLLVNGDLWKCDSSSWAVFGAPNFFTYRHPEDSSDGGCYMAFNCGGACMPGQTSVWQDVDVSSLGSRTVAYGGKFAVDSGTGASLLLVLWEFDADGVPLINHGAAISPTTIYEMTRNEVTLLPATRRLRYQVYLMNEYAFRADEMFIDTICGWLYPGESLLPGQSVWSCDGHTQLAHQTDGNVVLYSNGQALWHTQTYGQTTSQLAMQTDGNLVLYSPAGVLWHAGTWGHPSAALAIQPSCNAVIYAGGTPLWSTGTSCPPPIP